MNNMFFEFPLLRTLNTLLLAGIFATLVLIFIQIREGRRTSIPVEVVNEPSVEVTNEPSVEITNQPLEVEITNQPLEVEITNQPLEVEIFR
jgi:hypothetical protein